LKGAGQSIGGSCKFLQVGRRQVREHGQELVLQLDLMESIVQAATVMRAAANHLGMVVCAAAATDLGGCLKRLPPPNAGCLMLSERHLDDLISGLEYLLRTFRDEIDARPLFAMSPTNADLYDQPQPLFGAHVEDGFPSSAEDIAEAGKCLAVGRWTGAVMHLMRALEPPLAALATHVGIPSGVNWNKSLNEIEHKLRTVTKHGQGEKEEQWAAETASHFRAIKNAWRNHAMHGRSFYDEERATEIYEAARALMRHVSGRLREDDAGRT
jgi:hypothetical protein